MFMGVITGDRKPMQPPVDDMNQVWDIHQKYGVEQMLACSFYWQWGENKTPDREVPGSDRCG